MSTIGGKMGTIVKQSGKYKAVVHRKGHRHIYEIFDKISDAPSLSYKIFLPPAKL